MEKEDVKVNIEGNHLIIRGERKQVRDEKTTNWLMQEMDYGMFERSLLIPNDADRNALSAKIKNGYML
jgi:HSP20 family protein